MPPTPTHHVRVQAIVLAPPGQADPLTLSDGTTPFGAAEVAQQFAVANGLYAQTGIRFAFDPAKDLEGVVGDLAVDDHPDTPAARVARAALSQGKMVVYFREGGGGFSDEGSYVVVLKPGNGLHLAHEIGHSLGLSHVFRETVMPAKSNIDITKTGWTSADDLIRVALSNKPPLQGAAPQLTPALIAEGQAILEAALDGDSPGKPGVKHPVTDTPPSLHELPVALSHAVKCGAPLKYPVPVTFKPGVAHTFTYTPDRTNIMSYFDCAETNRFSAQQVAAMRASIETGPNRRLASPALRWSGWFEVPGEGRTDTAVAAVGAGSAPRLTVVAKGPRGQLFRASAGLAGNALQWSAWTELEGKGVAARAPAAAAFDNKLYVFAVGPTGRIFHNFAPLGEPLRAEWAEVPGKGVAGHGTAAAAFDNKLYVFAVGPTGRIFHNFAPPGEPLRAEWAEVPGKGTAAHGATAAAFDNRLYVFVTGPTGLIFHNFAPPGEPFRVEWAEMPGGGVAVSAPAAVAFGGRLYVFVVGTDGRVYMNQAPAGAPFTIWSEVPGGARTDAAPAAAVLNNQLYLFVKGKGADQRIFVNSATPG